MNNLYFYYCKVLSVGNDGVLPWVGIQKLHFTQSPFHFSPNTLEKGHLSGNIHVKHNNN